MIWVLLGLLWRRLLVSLPLLFVVSIVLFVVLRVLPTDPVAMMVPPTATKEDLEELRAAYGFDKPIFVQYEIWLADAVRGNLGLSTASRTPVTCRTRRRAGHAGAGDPRHPAGTLLGITGGL